MRNIALIGFMGTGKSTVGKQLAKRLQWTFVDNDSEVEREAGKRIPEIFDEVGEAYFRELEATVLKKNLNASHHVIATGGGVVLNPDNRALLLSNSTVVTLTASTEELIERLQSNANRPLLRGDLEANVKKRLLERQGLYDFGHVTVDTTGKKVVEIVEEILEKVETFPDIFS